MANKKTIQTAAYDKEHTRQFHLKLNITTDADIIAQLDKQPSMQGYIRALIRADIEAQKEK